MLSSTRFAQGKRRPANCVCSRTGCTHNREDRLRRVGALDAIRGLLILYVISVIHGLFWLNLVPQWAASWLLFGMPEIFMVSGYSYYLYERSRSERGIDLLNGKQYVSFLFARSTRILVPYFVYAISSIVLIAVLPLVKQSPRYAPIDLIPAWLDPFRFGTNYTAEMLNWQLWFVPVFLLISAALPIATRFRPLKNPSLLLLVIVVTVVEFLLTGLHFSGDRLIKETIFYLLFAVLGYYLARSRDYFQRINFGVIALFSAAMLALIILFSNDPNAANMQANKFPPTHIFFLFSCFWISLFLFIGSRTTAWVQGLDRLGRTFWLKPFVHYGYSIYLWQGIGYTVAVIIGQMINLPTLLVWLLAIGLSVVLGMIAGPAEKIRWHLPIG